jgi:predicted GIY-YIG superfamily endonuclease
MSGHNSPKQVPMYYIYGLHLEGDSEIRYVGSTTQPVTRLWQHRDARGEKVPERIEWAKRNGGQVCMKLLETVTAEPHAVEQRWIAHLRTQGHRLLNRRRATQQHVVSRERMADYLAQFPDDFAQENI